MLIKITYIINTLFIRNIIKNERLIIIIFLISILFPLTSKSSNIKLENEINHLIKTHKCIISESEQLYSLGLFEPNEYAFLKSFLPNHKDLAVSEKVILDINDEDNSAKETSVEYIISDTSRVNKQETVLGRVLPGREGRERVENSIEFPMCVHGQIISTFIINKNQTSAKGTGSLVGPNHVLTAGHVIYDKDFGVWASIVEFIPGTNGSNHEPFGRAKATQLLSLEGWTKDLNPHYDLGMIILDQSLGLKTGWLGIRSPTDAFLKECPAINITGYPGEKPHQEMYSMEHKVKKYTNEQIIYDIDTSPGQSGSCLWTKEGPDDYYTIGVHSYGCLEIDNLEEGNSATRITPAKFNVILEWLQKYQLPDFQKTNLYLFFKFLNLKKKSSKLPLDCKTQYIIGLCYEHGIGTDSNENEAEEYYLKAQREEKKAATRLGIIHENKAKLAQNYNEKHNFLSKAFKFYEEAATNDNDSTAQFLLGHCFEHGKGTFRNGRRAKELYIKSATNQSPHPEALTKLGIFLKYEKKFEEALEKFQKASELNSPWANFQIGLLHEWKNLGKNSSEEKAFEFYKKSAEANCNYAQNNLGQLFMKKHNYVEAIHWFNKAANHGNSRALNSLGQCYENGYGVQEDRQEALKYYNNSVLKGNTYAKIILSKIYYKMGRELENQNFSESTILQAIEYHKLAQNYNNFSAEANISNAYYKLGEYFENQGTETTLNKALEYYTLSERYNNFKAPSRVLKVKNKLRALETSQDPQNNSQEIENKSKKRKSE